MKRFLAALALLAVVGFVLFAEGAPGRVYPLGDDIYDMFDTLFVSAGQAMPSATRPWTASEARNELAKLDEAALASKDQKALYEKLQKMVGEPETSEKIRVAMALSPEAYFHTNEDYCLDEMWSYGFNDRSPFLTMSLDAYLDSFYTYCEMGYGWGRATNRDVSESLSDLAVANGKTWVGLGAVVPATDGNLLVVTRSDVYSRKAAFNFPTITQLEIDVPRQTYLTFAGDHLSFGYYRGRKQWGSSRIGNFIYDGHVSVYNTISLKVFGQKFAFDYSFMIPAQSYSNKQTSDHPADFRRVFATHRLDWYVLKNLTLSASENVMYRFDTADIDILNPSSIYHNNTNSKLLNAIAHVEVQYAPFAGALVYGQFCLDQATAPTESNTQDPAYGISAGIRYVRMQSGVLSLNLEGVYTSAALYRRDRVDFIIHTNNNTNRPYIRYPLFTYVGFRYGGDCMAARFDVDYDNLDGLGLYASASVIAQGQFGMLDSHNKDDDNTKVPNRGLKTPSGDADISYILNAGVQYGFEVLSMPAKAFLDVAWLSGLRSWHGVQAQDVQVSLGVSLQASSR